MKTPKDGEVYEHFKKGNWYQVITVAEEVDTLDLYVVYKQIPKNDEQVVNSKIWLRLAKEFMEDVEIDGKKIQRFKKVE